MNFSEKWERLKNLKGKVILKHLLFGRQMHNCDALQVINTEDRIGLVLKGQEVYVSKHNIQRAEVQGNMYVVSDELLQIAVIVNKL